MEQKHNTFVEIMELGGVIHTYCVHQEILDGVTWEHIKLFLPLPSSLLSILHPLFSAYSVQRPTFLNAGNALSREDEENNKGPK